MKAAYIQFDIRYLQPERNRARAEALLEGVEADLIVLPELFTSGYFFESTAEVESVAEEIPNGPTTAWLREQANARGATIVAGLAERENGRLYNSAAVVTPEGYAGTYRKVHLYYEEKLHFTTGDLGFHVFDLTTNSGEEYRLGVMICFDWYFPESARTLALSGADIIAHPSNLVRPNCPRAMPIRALENHVYTITANRIGEEVKGSESLRFIGQSKICSPEGVTMAESDRDTEEVRVVEVDPHLARERQITAHNDIFADRQRAAYRL